LLKVLIVDDEPLFRIAMREMINWEAFGCEIVSEASNGREALRYIEKNNVDLVLIDVQMPQLNGIQFLDKLIEMDLTLSPLVIILSAYSAYPYVRQAFQLRAYDYLVKEDLDESYVTPIL
jgi:two-component system response regulator YesN